MCPHLQISYTSYASRYTHPAFTIGGPFLRQSRPCVLFPWGSRTSIPCAFSHSLSRLPAPLRGDRRVRVRQEDDGGGGDGQQCQSSRIGVGSRKIVKARHRLRNEKGRTTATENFCCNDFLFFLNIFFCLGHFFGCMITFTFFDNMEISSTRS